LGLTHPVTREPLTFEAPLPDDCRRFLDQLNEERDEVRRDGQTAI
jgi:23S rRNA pseudouridine955/2504/2580 synthase